MNALIVVDVQNDFLPGGSLAVPEGDQVIPVINALMPSFDLIAATQDWHPPDHGSFAGCHPGRAPGEVIDLGGLQQVLWPDHCVQGTPGASFASALDVSLFNTIVRKGADRGIDSYSGFFDNDRRQATGMEQYLRDRSVDHLFICGLATDYCVKFTALDALHLGFEVTLIRDACRGVNLNARDVDHALEEMARAGAAIVTSGDL